jgi:phosphate transport system substrate-binding protein
MSHGLNKLSSRTKLLAGALALVIAGVSHAATLVGGGATLPSIGYVGPNAASELLVTGTDISSGSLFGVWSTANSGAGVSYCLTGSGAGKNILAGGTIGGTSYNVQNNCVKNASGTVTGFGATTVGRTTLTQPNFAGADSPLASSDFSNYVANRTGVTGAAPTQFPAIAGAVAIGFNLTDTAGSQITSSEVNFSDLQVCQIFSGAVTTWNDPALASAFTLPAGHSVPAQAIKVQYRSDGSGTSFSFSNHLSNVCTAANGFSTGIFETSQNFFSTTAGTTYVIQNFNSGALPTGWTGSSGNASVANAIVNTANAVGYVEAANALQTTPGLQFADVNGASPTTNFGSNLTIAASDLVFNNAITGNNSDGTASFGAISGAPSTTCIALVKPAQYAKAGTDIVPTGTYPIVAISYLLGNAVGNGTDLTNTRSLLIAPYTSSITSAVTTVGPVSTTNPKGTGLAFLTLGRGSFTTTQVSNCLAN